MRVQRLSDADRERLHGFYKSLSQASLNQRFCGVTKPEALERYMDGLNFDRTEVQAFLSEEGVILGVLELGLEDGIAELAVAVAEGLHGMGLGARLAAAGEERARELGAHELHVHTLAYNKPMHRLARKLGMTVTYHPGEMEARKALV